MSGKHHHTKCIYMDSKKAMRRGFVLAALPDWPVLLHFQKAPVATSLLKEEPVVILLTMLNTDAICSLPFQKQLCS